MYEYYVKKIKILDLNYPLAYLYIFTCRYGINLVLKLKTFSTQIFILRNKFADSCVTADSVKARTSSARAYSITSTRLCDVLDNKQQNRFSNLPKF